MSSYIQSINEEQEYVAVLNASKCKTYSGFMKEMVNAFSLPENASNNINDISGYIFSSWLGLKKIKIIFANSGSFTKDPKHFNEIMDLLKGWKNYWESLSPENRFVIEES